MEEFFKEQSEDELNRSLLRQLCYDAQVNDDEIEDLVDAIIAWKDKVLEIAIMKKG